MYANDLSQCRISLASMPYSVGIGKRLRAGRLVNWNSIPGGAKGVSLYHSVETCSDADTAVVKARGGTTHLHVISKLKISGSIPLFRLTSSWLDAYTRVWTYVILPLT
jgi:hypothetical protein